MDDIESLCNNFNNKIDINANISTAVGLDGLKIRRPLNVSTLSHYFGLECDEYLRLSLKCEENGDRQKHRTPDFIQSQTIQRGITFESNIKSYFDQQQTILSHIHDENEFSAWLNTYLATTSISSNNKCHIGYNIKFKWQYDLSLGNYKPDFLLIKSTSSDNCDAKYEITVCDAKASSQLRVEHCVQVALYAIDLRHWLIRNNFDKNLIQISKYGEIWLPSTEISNENSLPFERKIFPLEKLEIRLEFFLHNELKKVLTGNEWMMLPRCQQCEFAAQCRQRAIYSEPNHVNNLSYLTSTIHHLIQNYFKSLYVNDIEQNLNLININSTNDNEDQNGDTLFEEKIKLYRTLAVEEETQGLRSTAIKAVTTHVPQLKQVYSLLLPQVTQDLKLMVLSIIQNPVKIGSVAILGYNIYDVSTSSWHHLDPIIKINPSSTEIVSTIVLGLNRLRQLNSPCQIVCFDESERQLLFNHLTLASDHPHIDDCLVLLNYTESAVQLSYPPDMTENVFQNTQISTMKKNEIEEKLEQKFNIKSSSKTTKVELAQQLRTETTKIQDESRANLVGLACFICLHTAIKQSYIIPMPGYFDLDDLKYLFTISLPSQRKSEILKKVMEYKMCDNNELSNVSNSIQEYLNVLARLFTIVQQELSQASSLQLQAKCLPTIQPIIAQHSHIRRLLFLRQYEMLFGLRQIQYDRYGSTEHAILIKIQQIIKVPLTSNPERYNLFYECFVERGLEFLAKNMMQQPLDVIAELGGGDGSVGVNSNEFRMYQYLISDDDSNIQSFPDAIYMDQAIDSIRNLKLDKYALANVEKLSSTSSNDPNVILLKVKGLNANSSLKLKVNNYYWLNERYTDFNTKKSIQGLNSVESLTIQLLDNPVELFKSSILKIENNYEQQTEKLISDIFSTREATIRPTGLHMLNKAQQDASKRVRHSRIQLIWGPPGTGKTYWSAVTILQILMMSAANKSQSITNKHKPSNLRILITAFTHAAIDNLLDSVKNVVNLFSQNEQWSMFASQIKILKLNVKNYRELSVENDQGSIVCGSTVWTLQKLDNKIKFDLIFIDESTQLLTSDAVLALNRLSSHETSRLIVAGDPLQLSPVRQCTYPHLPSPTPDLFSSIFHCLLRDEDNLPISLNSDQPFEDISKCPYLSIFHENHRMNNQLSEFTRILYGNNYKQGRPGQVLDMIAIERNNDDKTQSFWILDQNLSENNSLYTILVDNNQNRSYSIRDDLELESLLVKQLIDELSVRFQLPNKKLSIFIITPHRTQRLSIRRKLQSFPLSSVDIVCDTVERMQGKEANIVLICMMYRNNEQLKNELNFIFNRQRVNVSITRAKQLCLLITSQTILNPPLSVFVQSNTRNAYTLLTNFIQKSKCIQLDNFGQIR